MYNYLVALLEEELGVERKKGAIVIFILYLIVGAPIAAEGIITGEANLVYFTEVDNWIGNYLLIVLGLLEVITLAWLVKDEGLEEMNRGGLWHVPKWFYRVFHQFLTPICIIVFLAIFTKDYWTAGNFKITPSYIEGIEYMAPWVNAARLVVVVVLIIGFAQTYRAIKRKYKDEIESNKVNA